MPDGLTHKSDAAHKKSAKRQSGGVYAFVIVRGGIPDHAFYSRDLSIVRQTHKIVKGGADAFAVRPRRLTHSWSEYVNERRLQRAFAFARDSVASKLSLSLLRELKVAGGKEGHQSTAE